MNARAGLMAFAISLLASSLAVQAPLPAQASLATQAPLAQDHASVAQGYDFRYGIPPGTDLEVLVGKPIALAMTNVEFTDAATGEFRMSGYADFHGVFDVPPEYAERVLVDFESYSRFMPWITKGEILQSAAGYYRLSFSVGISLFGLKVGYVTESESRVDSFPDGSIGLRSRMLTSPDGNLYEHYLSWYFAPVVVGGKRMTYVRYFARPGLRKPSRLTVAVVKNYAEANVRDQVTSFMKEAARRAKNS